MLQRQQAPSVVSLLLDVVRREGVNLNPTYHKPWKPLRRPSGQLFPQPINRRPSNLLVQQSLSPGHRQPCSQHFQPPSKQLYQQPSNPLSIYELDWRGQLRVNQGIQPSQFPTRVYDVIPHDQHHEFQLNHCGLGDGCTAAPSMQANDMNNGFKVPMEQFHLRSSFQPTSACADHVYCAAHPGITKRFAKAASRATNKPSKQQSPVHSSMLQAIESSEAVDTARPSHASKAKTLGR